MSLKITVGNDTVEQEYSYDLKPHTWNALDIDLAGLLIKTEGKINRINLSCAPGGRTLYLDHIYLLLLLYRQKAELFRKLRL